MTLKGRRMISGKEQNENFQGHVGLLLAFLGTVIFADSVGWAQSETLIQQAQSTKKKTITLVNKQSSAAEVFINLAADSKVNVNSLLGFCDSESTPPLNCHLTLAANTSLNIPNPNFQYINFAVSFNHSVSCGATKAEVIGNNPNWF